MRIDGFRVLINGKAVFQRTVLDQGYYPDGICTAPSDEALRRDIELSMRLGFNGARLHQKIFEPRYLYHCDKLGYLVWGEHASWGLDIGKAGALLNFLPEWSEAVERDFDHPALIGWCPFNETWGGGEAGKRLLRAVYEETKRLDPTRPVIDASGYHHVVTDIYDQHDYEQAPAVLREKYARYDGTRDSFKLWPDDEDQRFLPGLPLFVSEFGGIKWIPPRKRGTEADNAWGYGDAPTTEEEFFARYEGQTAALLDAPNVMGFCYTQLFDVEQEVNGLYTYEREDKFADYSRVIAANRRKAAIED